MIALCRLDGAGTEIRVVETQQVAAKIGVNPACKGLKLTDVAKLKEKMPEVAECLNNGMWNKKAEEALLKRYKKS